MTLRALVLGGGITGLVAAERLVSRLGPDAVLLVESEPRLGGKIRTEHRDGFVLEGGPDCFLAMKPGGVALCRHLGLEDRVTPTNPALRRSFIKRGGRLHPIPEGISGLVPSRVMPLMTTRILSVAGRIRAGLEFGVPRRRATTPESVADFGRRRFGAEAWDYLMEPLLSGIYAGDGNQLSLDATFPQLRAMEATHGSLLRGMVAARRRLPAASPSPAGFVTLPGGLGELVDALAARVPVQSVRLGLRGQDLRRTERGSFAVLLADGTTLEAAAVIVTTPAHVTANLVAAFDPALAEILAGIPFASTATVSLAFPKAAVRHPLAGYGYVSPRAEKGRIVACTWTSNKFPGRAPEDMVLLRAFLGRAGQPELLGESDDTLVRWTREELAAIHGITAPPAFVQVTRWPRGMPQYTLGHPARLERIAERLALAPGLLLAGASYRGVGIPDCITAGWEAADRAAAHVDAA
jgi:oxygen-dependent protoporphyrinogen oxidase